MYAKIWKILPGPKWLKIIESIVIILIVILLLSFVIYPFVSQFMPEPGVVVE